MENDAPVKTLIASKQFRKKLGAYFGCEHIKSLECEEFSRGFCKVVWKITSPELPRSFLVKEIRFKDTMAPEDSEDKNQTHGSEEAFYELDTIRAIQRAPALKNQFSHTIGLFAVKHPVLDSYTGDVELEGGEIRLESAKKLLKDEGRGVSLFIVEEIVKGRKPSEDEIIKAKRIRAEGMKTNPRIWLTVDCGADDFLVRDDGSITFFDVGNICDLTNKEEIMLQRFMQSDRPVSR